MHYTDTGLAQYTMYRYWASTIYTMQTWDQHNLYYTDIRLAQYTLYFQCRIQTWAVQVATLGLDQVEAGAREDIFKANNSKCDVTAVSQPRLQYPQPRGLRCVSPTRKTLTW